MPPQQAGKVLGLLTRLASQGFRNLVDSHWSLGPGHHLILGDNGAGKTSLLEAIYLLATTRSFRTSQLADCCRHETRRLVLEGRIEGDQRGDLALHWSPESGIERRLDDKRVSLSKHLAVQPVLAWTAADSQVLSGAPEARRRLLDRGLVGAHPAALGILARYRKTLRAKRELLARRHPPVRGDELAPWNELLAESAVALIARRAAYAEALQDALEQMLGLCELDFPPIRLRYRPSPADGLDGVSSILGALERASVVEKRKRQPLVGPHRDDLEVRWDGHPLRRVASAGERKALGLVLLAAQAEVLRRAEREPLILLDDADTELDRGRLASVWRGFSPAIQLLATSNRPTVWHDIPLDRVWHCDRGRLSESISFVFNN